MSADSDEDSFSEYFAEMPWTAVPFDASQREGVGEPFGVEGIPRVVVLNGATGEVVNGDARAAIAAKKSLIGLF